MEFEFDKHTTREEPWKEDEWEKEYLIRLIDQVEGDNHFVGCGCFRGRIAEHLRKLMPEFGFENEKTT